MLNDPKINEQIDAALAETDIERQYTLWGDLDQQIQQLAVTIPILYEKAIRLTGSNVARRVHPPGVRHARPRCPGPGEALRPARAIIFRVAAG